MSLLNALIVKNSNILPGIYFIFLKTLCIINLEYFQYQIWSSIIKWLKYLSSKTNFGSVFDISCSYFWLKLCQRHYNFKELFKKHNLMTSDASMKQKAAEATIHKILQINSSFYVKQCPTWKVKIFFSAVFCQF